MKKFRNFTRGEVSDTAYSSYISNDSTYEGC
jgi:hypothetical protein